YSINNLFMNPATVDELRSIIALNDLPDEHLQWILDRSDLTEYEEGAMMTRYGEPIDVMWFILEGRFDYYIDMNGQQVLFYTFKNDAATGGVGGVLPYSRLKTSPGYSYSVGKTRCLSLHKKYFHELEQLNPDLIQRLIGFMTERARSFATIQLQHEKVSALGKLAAGIAHELNNPAAAISRISSELVDRLNQNYALTEKLLQYDISADHIQRIRKFVESVTKSPAGPKVGALQRLEMEDDINAWLEQLNIPANQQVCETLAEAGIRGKDLEQIRANVTGDALMHLFNWLENLLSSQRLLKDLGEASARISVLVGAVKSHVQMDRTNELHLTNLHTDIDNTLTLLGYKLREKNIKVIKNYCQQLPEIPAYVGELNQIWTNLIDNAIYAMNKDGELSIDTVVSGKNVITKITDNGTGIPNEIINRIFDPFFTTKKVGEGTGIGLDLVNRIIKHHHGEIKVNSRPGRTEFEICIPISETKENSL
ncbi:MAG TPA: ATP-binding protein, partial [Cyclobacteriaceae bacterium]|nr:ATP-binding protein [Cyclobacteriaceae bacterium]